MATYQVEPYVMAGDVYAGTPHSGRGGWSWYTGAAGWMYRLIIESLLGLQREGDHLHLAPCLPKVWPELKIDYRYGQSVYRIQLAMLPDDADSQNRLLVDGAVQSGLSLLLQDDGSEHSVELWINRAT